jgi:hypothetical protein
MDSSTIYAIGHGDSMSIYMQDGSGQNHYLLKHRKNSDLYRFLRDGRSVANIYRYKPSRNKREQQLYSSLHYIVRVAKWINKYEVAA